MEREPHYNRVQVTFAKSLYGRSIDLAKLRDRSFEETLEDGIIILAALKLPDQEKDLANRFAITDPGNQEKSLVLERDYLMMMIGVEKYLLLQEPKEWVPPAWNNIPDAHVWVSEELGYASLDEMYTDAMLAACNAFEPLYQK